MGVIQELVTQYYQEFAGLPNGNPIVRSNIPEDAFTLAILKVMYAHNLDFDIKSENIEKISNIIVAPPDSGIDLFIETQDGDEYYYDVIQSKYTSLTEEEIRSCFLSMKDALKRYLKNRNQVTNNLRSVIEETNFTDSYKSNCTYYVFHTGTLNYGNAFKNNEKIVTLNEMEIIYKSLGREDHALKVPFYEFTADMFNNYILYQNTSDNAMLCNIRGYDLAELCNKYISSSMGRNILFGLNLRDSLDEKKSKTYQSMVNTINNEPERFWNYNNGITIICEDLDAKRPRSNADIDLIQISNFSIINGAQTTSALGSYLRDAIHRNDEEAKERLKKVYVLVRIMQVNNESLRNSISIYNNLQNPISSRDQVANNYEQLELHNRLLKGESPNIFVEIRRGQHIPPQPRFEKHQQTTNEDLAQIAFAAFLQEPFKAKDKKKTLFNKSNSDEHIINAAYDEIFYLSKNEEDNRKGIIFKKSKQEIDEALFIKQLYLQSRNSMKRYYDSTITKCNERIQANPGTTRQQEMLIQNAQKNKDINNTCMLYCITLYFALKNNYGEISTGNTFDYFKYYRDTRNSSYRNDIIKYFSDNFLRATVQIIGKLLSSSGSTSSTNWMKRPQSQDDFFEALTADMAINMDYMTMYQEFIERFSV